MPPKNRDILKRLQEEGWIQKDQKGSHRQLVHPVKPGKVTIAGHPSDEPADGTYRNIQRQAGWKP
jgi:predicted RNA binding protein YcfA (HicA-like mRNA interferase family)